MIFRCEREEFSRAVNSVLRAVPTRAMSTAVDGVLLKTDGSVVSATGYNLRIGMLSEFEAEVFENGEVVIDSGVLSQILSKLPDGELTVKCDEKLKVCITAGRATYNLVGTSADDFPELPQIDILDSIDIDAAALSSIISGVAFAASDNESKPLYTGVLFEIAGKDITAVALDGYRLAVRRETLAEAATQEMKFVLPADALRETMRFIKGGDSVTVRLGKLHAIIVSGNTLLVTRRLDGEFMDWRSALASKGDICATVSRDELLSHLDRVSVVLNEHFKAPVICNLKDRALLLTAETPIGRAEDKCGTDCKEELRIGFNCRYLMDALKAADGDKVRLMLKNAQAACVILPDDDTDDSFAYLVLPVRIRGENE